MNTDNTQDTRSTWRVMTDALLGRKHYAVILAVVGTAAPMELSSHIFDDIEDARRHWRVLTTTLSYRPVAIVSFRTRTRLRTRGKLRGPYGTL